VTTVEQARHVCSLGALQSVLAMPRSVPILHAGPGCGQKLWGAVAEANGYQGAGYAGGSAVPCSNFTEREVIFGGEDRLREEIANALKVMDADLFAVLTGCTPDIVGDDVRSVVQEFQKQGAPIFWAETGGFRGSNYEGHERVLLALIEQHLAKSGDIERGLVNIWSIVPYQDTFWEGDIEALSSLIASLGLRPNTIFGYHGGPHALADVARAELNLLVSPWLGLRAMKALESRFGTPFLHYPVLPIGPAETSRFLRELGQAAGVESKKVESVIDEQERRYFHFVGRSADILLEVRMGIPARFVTIADSFYAPAIARFLAIDFGLRPEHTFIIDRTPPEHQDAVRGLFAGIHDDLTEPPVIFTNDGGVIRETLRSVTFPSRPFVIGSNWDRVLAREFQGYPLSVSLPCSDRLVMSRTYAGYEGGLRLAEDLYSVVFSYHQ